MEVPHKVSSGGRGRGIILTEIEKTMKNINALLGEIVLALAPSYGINWGPEVMKKCGPG